MNEVSNNGNEYKQGDIVKVRKEWLDAGEDGSMQYVVLEVMGNLIKVEALGTGLALAPTYVYDSAWVEKA